MPAPLCVTRESNCGCNGAQTKAPLAPTYLGAAPALQELVPVQAGPGTNQRAHMGKGSTTFMSDAPSQQRGASENAQGRQRSSEEPLQLLFSIAAAGEPCSLQLRGSLKRKYRPCLSQTSLPTPPALRRLQPLRWGTWSQTSHRCRCALGLANTSLFPALAM